MIFNEGIVKLAVCVLVLCTRISCSEVKVHTGDTQDQTSSRPNTLFDDADDIQRQLDNEARDRFKYGRPKAIWILNIPTQVPLMANTFERVHRRPRNPVTSAAWKHRLYAKSKPSKKNDIEPKSEYLIVPKLKYKIDAEPEPNNDIFLVPESNTKNNIEPEQTFDYIMKQGDNDNDDLGPQSGIINSMDPDSDNGIDIKYSDYETGTEDVNDLGLPSDVQNSMGSGSDVMDDIKQGPDNQDYETGIDIDNDLGPDVDVKNSMEPDFTVKEGPYNPFYAIGADSKNNAGPPLDVNDAVEPVADVKNDVKTVPDNPDITSGYTPTQSAEDKNTLGPSQGVKNAKESGLDINDDLKQGSDNLDSSTEPGAEENNSQGTPLDIKTTKKPSPDVNSDVKQETDNSDSTTQSAEVNNNLGPPQDDKNAKEAGPDVNNDVKQESENKDGDVLVGSSVSWSYKEQDKWVTAFPTCGLYSQSPVDLPSKGLVGARGARPLTFINYDVIPLQLRLKSDGKTVTLSGDWEDGKRPLIYGGAGHSRRYRFHSLTLHAPSEHTIEKLLFPLETQVLHVSTDYATFDDAVKGSTKDHLAFLGIVNIYKYGCRTEPALKQLLKVAAAATASTDEVRVDNAPLSAFCPPFGEYACYHGSLPTPPCTEAVLWLIRGKALPLEREVASTVKMAAGNRLVQPLNDRRVILFNKK